MTNRSLTLAVFAAALATASAPRDARAQPAPQRFNLVTYVSAVGQGNLDLLAQRSNVPIAEAQISVAKVFPDPIVTGGLLQYDVTQQGNPTATSVSVLVPLQIAGQRSARIEVAQAAVAAVSADVEDVARVLRAEAASAYVDGLRARLILDLKKRSLAGLERLVGVNEQRNKSGDVGEVVVVQSRVEAHQFRAQVIAADGDVRAADLKMVQLLGSLATPWSQPLELEGDLKNTADKTFDAGALVQQALQLRPDVRAAHRRTEQASRQVSLARANRWFDVAVGVTWQHSFPMGLGPRDADMIGATLSVPIPFSRAWRGELDAAHAQEAQAGTSLKAAAVRVEMEVRRAVVLYDTASARVKAYTGGGVLHDADSVLEKILFNYQRGGATLVEVIVAQRTVNDVYLAYFDALADSAHALVALQQAVGTWDVTL
jgi:cobalt-zinc-cadmium efflux system outer membrane protein